MYALTKDEYGKLFMEVVVGGFAMENLVIPLSEEEELKYRTNGKSELNSLAHAICQDLKTFRPRVL